MLYDKTIVDYWGIGYYTNMDFSAGAHVIFPGNKQNWCTKKKQTKKKRCTSLLYLSKSNELANEKSSIFRFYDKTLTSAAEYQYWYSLVYITSIQYLNSQ